MDPSNICSIVYYIYYEKEENIERRMVFGALVYCIWGVFGVFDRVFLLCEVAPSWDWGQVLESASEYVLKGTLDAKEYYARYTIINFA